MSNTRVLSLLCLILHLSSCISLEGEDECLDTIYLKNISSNSIVVAALKQADCSSSDNDAIISIPNGNCLYDTILHENSSDYYFYLIESNSKRNFYHWDCSVANVLTDTMSIFMFDNAVYSNNPWESLVDNDIILARYDIPIRFYLDNFDNNKHPITYPPTDEMSGIVVRYYKGERIE